VRHHDPLRVELLDDVEGLLERRLDAEHRMLLWNATLARQGVILRDPHRHDSKIDPCAASGGSQTLPAVVKGRWRLRNRSG